MNRHVINARKDLGGELAKLSEVSKLLEDEYQCGLKMRGVYSSWINGNFEQHIRMIESMGRILRGDANLPKKLWCYPYEHVTDIYGALMHSATKETSDY